MAKGSSGKKRSAANAFDPIGQLHKLSIQAAAAPRAMPEAEAIASVGTDTALGTIAALPAPQAEVVLLGVAADLSVAGVASIVGRNYTAVRALHFRAMQRLAREVAGGRGASAS